jgi:ankyrin repeat protein
LSGARISDYDKKLSLFLYHLDNSNFIKYKDFLNKTEQSGVSILERIFCPTSSIYSFMHTSNDQIELTKLNKLVDDYINLDLQNNTQKASLKISENHPLVCFFRKNDHYKTIWSLPTELIDFITSNILVKTDLAPQNRTRFLNYSEVLTAEKNKYLTIYHLLESKLLDYYSADINKTDNQGKSLLHYAAINGDLLAIEKLITLGSDVNKKDYDGNSPLHLFINNHFYSENILRVFRAANFNFDLRNNKNESVLDKLTLLRISVNEFTGEKTNLINEQLLPPLLSASLDNILNAGNESYFIPDPIAQNNALNLAIVKKSQSISYKEQVKSEYLKMFNLLIKFNPVQ